MRLMVNLEMATSELQSTTAQGRRPATLAAIEQITAFFQRDLFRRRWAPALLLAALFSLCVLRTYFGGPIPMKRYGPDAFLLLDGGWRVLNGQIPHVDFYTALGPITYLLVAFGMKLFSSSAVGLSFTQAMVGAVLALWSYRISIRRLGAVPSIIFCFFAVLLSLAPYEIGESPLDLAPSFTYNRYAYVLLTLILLEALCPPRAAADSREESIGGISTGVALGILLFLKISFFLVAVPLLGVLVVWRRPDRRRWIGCAIGFTFVFLAAVGYLHGHLGAVWNDLRLAAGAKRIAPRAAVEILLQNSASMVWLISLAFFVSFAISRTHDKPITFRLPFIAAAVCGIGYLTILGNHQDKGLPLGVALAIILTDWLSNKGLDREAGRHSSLFRAVLLFWCAFLWVPPIASDAISLGYGAYKSMSYTRSAVLEFDSEQLKPMLFMGSAESKDFGRSHVACINEGLQMLRPLPANEPIMALSYSNPFPHALGRPPAHGGTTWFGDGNNFSDRSKPPLEPFFGNASIVIVSKYVTDGGAVRGFGDYLPGHYRLAQESRCWSLYRRQ